ncbi:MAG: lamin tail domain-containing protein, partial [Bacteroidota bacterium]
TRLFADPDFDLAWWDRWFELRRADLSTTSLNALIDSVGNIAAEAVMRDRDRWLSSGYDFRYGGYAQEIQEMKTWLQQRCEWIDAQFIPPPGFSLEGGVISAGFGLSLSNPHGTGEIYYTIDGTDPRDFGGALSGNAQLYGTPIIFNGSGAITVSARIRDGGSWGAKCSFGFILPQDLNGLVINEIHYHPEDSLALEGDSFEFIELFNSSANSLNLSALSFGGGLEYVFPAGSQLPSGEYYVIASDLAHFESLYGFPADGEYTGLLANGGEKVRLLGPTGQTVDEVDYDDKLPWPTAADGFGPSLELISPQLDNDQAGSWRASVPRSGTPKAANSRYCDPAPPEVVINEIQYRYTYPLGSLDAGDWLELYNPNPAPIDLSGWQLQDQQNSYGFPAGSTIERQTPP